MNTAQDTGGTLTDELADALEHGDIIHALDVFKVLATPAMVIGSGASNMAIGAWIGLGAAGVAGPAAVFAGAVVFTIGVFQVGAGAEMGRGIFTGQVGPGPSPKP